MISQYDSPSDNIAHLFEAVAQLPSKARGPGRPRVITEEMKPLILELRKKGYGYRAISKILARHDISVHWSTIQRFIKKQEVSRRHPIQICVSRNLKRNYNIGH